MLDQLYIDDLSSPQNPIRYTKQKFLGKGGFAKVYEVSTPSFPVPLACKIIEKQSITKPRSRQKLMNEIRIHRSLCHKSIVKFHNYFEDEEHFYILLELCPYESLNVLLRRRKRLMELEVQSYLVHVLLGIKYLHESSIIHRDIKLANILISGKMEVKLADFGLSTKVEYEGERKRTICGTPNYMAPEILTSENGHSYEVDIWSFGVLMFTMLVGKPPFDTGDPKTTYHKIKSGFYSFPDNVQITSQAKELISKILVLNPAKRPTIDQIFDHDFFNKNKIPKILPISTLTVPLSDSYQRAFDRKPLTPREFLAHSGEEENKIQRSTSQANIERSQPRLRLADSGSLSRDSSSSVQTTTATALPPRSCVHLKKLLIDSSYIQVSNGPSVWVRSWIDYSHKYGMVYKLSNGCIGICFNDETKLVIDPHLCKSRYYSKSPESGEKFENFTLSEPPAHLSKKARLVVALIKKMTIDCEKEGSIEQAHVKKWILTQHVVLFRMTNKMVQAYFRDKSEVFLCGMSKIVTFINKSGEVRICPVSQVMESENKEMIKRVKFLKEVLLGTVKKKITFP